jgi:hypothetical protein
MAAARLVVALLAVSTSAFVAVSAGQKYNAIFSFRRLHVRHRQPLRERTPAGLTLTQPPYGETFFHGTCSSLVSFRKCTVSLQKSRAPPLTLVSDARVAEKLGLKRC